MPGLDGITATSQLRAALPSCRVLVVTTFGRPGYLRRAMAAGASGFVVKDTPARQLADAVRRVASGLRVVDPSLAAETLAAGDSPLTPRETRCCGRPGTVARSRISPPPAPVRGHGAQPPVRGHRQDRCAHPGRGSAPGQRERLAAGQLSGARYAAARIAARFPGARRALDTCPRRMYQRLHQHRHQLAARLTAA